jgi:hypothetical protein
MVKSMTKRFVARGIMTLTESRNGLRIEWHDKSRVFEIIMYSSVESVRRVLDGKEKQAIWSALEEDSTDPKEDIVYRLHEGEDTDSPPT